MKRELWAIAKGFLSGIQIINSVFCSKDSEQELSEEEKWDIVEFINSEVSNMMLEDAEDIISDLDQALQL